MAWKEFHKKTGIRKKRVPLSMDAAKDINSDNNCVGHRLILQSIRVHTVHQRV